LPEVFVQNASIEIAWTKTVYSSHSISGEIVAPFFTKNQEGFDINLPEDLALAKILIDKDKSILPKIKIPAYK
jgi:N-acylneuraminate cytidylyltransferase